ncbi:unnamed protein product [Bathycoccus prasinos]
MATMSASELLTPNRFITVFTLSTVTYPTVIACATFACALCNTFESVPTDTSAFSCLALSSKASIAIVSTPTDRNLPTLNLTSLSVILPSAFSSQNATFSNTANSDNEHVSSARSSTLDSSSEGTRQRQSETEGNNCSSKKRVF